MLNNYSFREATPEDLSLILKWTEELMDHEALDISIELPLVNNISELLENWLINLIDDDNTLIIIANDEQQNIPKGIIIGYLQIQPNEFTVFEMHGVIQMVWVEKDQRKQGLAMQLVRHMEDTFKNLKVPYCEIQYSASNKEAAAFWSKVGYKQVSYNSRKMLS